MLDSNFNLKVADFGFSSNKTLNKTRMGTDGYMAPEIYMGHKYSGQAVDLFAAGIVLFIMVTQHPPFTKATPKDQLYKAISANRLDVFWKAHSLNEENGIDFISDSLKDLISSMLAFDPVHRPSLAEIKEHEWYNGPVPTYEEIKEEFIKRKHELDLGNLQDGSPLPTGKVDPSVFTTHSPHRGIEEDEEGKRPTLERQVVEYVPEFKRYSQFFSTSSLDDLFNTLALFAEKMSTKFEFSEEEYSANMEITEEVHTISLSVNILKVDGENKYWVEVIKNSGDRFAFNGVYKNLKEFFGGHVNALESS